MESNRKSPFLGIIIGFVTTLAIASPLVLQAQADYESFRQDLVVFVETFGTEANSDLIADIQEMSFEELQTYYFLLSDPSVFARANEQAEAREALRQELQPLSLLEPLSHLPSSSYPPDYPSGGNYDVYTASLPGLGIMLAGPQNRTDASAVGGAFIAYDVLEFAALAAQAVCDASLLGAPVACPLAGVANAAARADQIVLQQAAYQDGLIDGAEIEAAYENSVTIIGQGNDLATDLETHDANIDGDLAAHDANIDADLAAHDANIDADLAAHDANIDADLVQHDADIKELLENLQGAVDENQRLIKITMSRQLEIMRLLITPSGRRQINPEVLNCTGDDCPVYPGFQLCPDGSLDWNCGD
jgi:hypothetical protein